MPELNPRRLSSRRDRFGQIAAAVLAGMGAMYCIQNLDEARRARPSAEPAPIPAAPAPAPEPELAAPAPSPRPPAPAPSSMLLKSEPGVSGVDASVAGVFGEQAPPRIEQAPEAPKKKAKAPPPRLQNRAMDSPFASGIIRNDGSRFAPIQRRAPKEEPEPEAPKPAAPKPAAGAAALKVIERPEPAPENLKPALIAQIAPPERVFWTRERQYRFGAAALLAVLGVVYFIYASGALDAREAEEDGKL